MTAKFLASFGHTKALLYETASAFGLRPEIRSEEWTYDELFLPVDRVARSVAVCEEAASPTKG